MAKVGSIKVLDLFSGLGGWSQAFKDRGHDVTTIDLDFHFNPSYVRNIMYLESLDQFGKFDIILASPPCNCFSTMSIPRYWPNHEPTIEARRAIDLVTHTLELIEKQNPKFWVMENPVGMLRKFIGMPQTTIAYCRYGFSSMKPTDLWGSIPKAFVPQMCNYNNPDHEHVPRRTNRGIQGMRKGPERAMIPYGLSTAMCIAAERDYGIKVDSMQKPIRQGDIYLIPIDKLPEGAKQKSSVIAEGEITGHKHQIQDGEVLIKDGTQYVIAKQRTVLLHEEHKQIQIPKGTYEVRRKREYSPLNERQVMD